MIALAPLWSALGPVLKLLMDSLLPFVWGIINKPDTMEDGASSDDLKKRLQAQIDAAR